MSVRIQLLRQNVEAKKWGTKFLVPGLILVFSVSMPFIRCANGQKTPLSIDRVDSQTAASHSITVYASGGWVESNAIGAGEVDPDFSVAFDNGVGVVVFDPHAAAYGRAASFAVCHDSDAYVEVAENVLPIEAEGHEMLGSYAFTNDRFSNTAWGDYEIGDPGGPTDTWIEGKISISAAGRDYSPQGSYYVVVGGGVEIGDSHVAYYTDDDGVWVSGVLYDLDGPHPIFQHFSGGFVELDVRQYVEPEEIIRVSTSISGEMMVSAGAGYEDDFAALWGAVGSFAEMQAYHGVPD
jgi:hypothetical protein